jgi:hypothetical protein
MVPNMDKSDSFEIDDLRRSIAALKELRSCCRTAEAIRSFEDFAHEIDTRYEQQTAARQQTAESNTSFLAAGLRPKVLAMDRNIAAATMKLINTEPKSKPTMTRAKTMGDIVHITKTAADSTSAKNIKVGWRRPSYLKAQEEVLASERTSSAERRVRAVATSQKKTRRSDIGVGDTHRPNMALNGKMPPPPPKVGPRHSLPRKSSGSNGGTGTNAEMLKRVFSESVRSVRKMGRSFTGLSGSGDG